MERIIGLLIAMALLAPPSFAVSRQSAPPVPPAPSPTETPLLSEQELREILGRLYDLGSAWAENDALRGVLQQIQALNARERDLAARELATEQQRTELAVKEGTIAKEQAEFYRKAFEAATKKRSKKCWAWKIISAGLGRCG